jgi:hypothetical protein
MARTNAVGGSVAIIIVLLTLFMLVFYMQV